MTPHLVRKIGRLVPSVGIAIAVLVPSMSAQGSTGKLQGIVRDSLTSSPVPGATILVRGTAFRALTDSNGYYFINGIPAGSYDVRASFVAHRSVELRGVRIRSGQTATQHVALARLPAALQRGDLPRPRGDTTGRYVDGVAVHPNGSIGGVVRDQDRRPIPNARVLILGTGRMAIADSLGRFRFEDVPAGTYDVRASYIGYRNTELRGLRVMSRQTVTQDFPLKQVEVEIQDPLYRRID